MPFRQPIVQRPREQKHLVQIAVAKLFAHAPISRTFPHLSTENETFPSENYDPLTLSGVIYLRQTSRGFDRLSDKPTKSNNH